MLLIAVVLVPVTGSREAGLHAAIGFRHTFVLAAVTLLFAVVSARLVD